MNNDNNKENNNKHSKTKAKRKELTTKKDFENVLFGVYCGKKTLVLDPCGLPKIPLIAFVNDCRKDIRCPDLSDNDKEMQNVAFIEARVNNWPSYFMIATRDIAHNEQLLTYYGPGYWQGMKSFETAQMVLDKTKKFVDSLS